MVLVGSSLADWGRSDNDSSDFIASMLFLIGLALRQDGCLKGYVVSPRLMHVNGYHTNEELRGGGLSGHVLDVRGS